MIKYLPKFDITSVDTGVVIQGCNCRGGYGAGVSGAIARKWPKVYEAYSSLTFSPSLLGSTQTVIIDKTLLIVNCFTQKDFGGDGKVYANADAIRRSLKDVYELASFTKLPVYMPKIGSGLGGLSWENDVEPIVQDMDTRYETVDTYVCVFP